MTNGMMHGKHSHGRKAEPDFHDDMHAFLIPLKAGDPGPKKAGKIMPPHIAIFFPESGSHLQIKRAKNPSPNGSLGYINRFVLVPDVTSPGTSSFSRGTLIISFHDKSLGSVAIETLRIFHWMEQKKAYHLIHRSGVGQSRDYVWARTTRPGIYAVIGINADPLIARTLGIMHYLHGWLHVGGQPAQKGLYKRICRLVLFNPEIRKLIRNRNFARRLVEENLRHGLPGKWPGGIPPLKTLQQWRQIEKICNSPNFPHEPPEASLLTLNVSTPAVGGQWEVLGQSAEILAVHAALLRTGKVLYFSGSEHDKKQHKKKKIDHTRLWDPATGNVETVGSPLHDLFCCGHSFLNDGKLLAAGGTQKYGKKYKGLRNSTIFDPGFGLGQNPWITASMMHTERGKTTGGGRWYPTLVTLADGQVLTVSGYPEKGDTRPKNIMVEIFNPSPQPLGTYVDKGDQPDLPKGYPRIHLLPDGQVYCSSEMNGKSMKWNPATNAKTDLPGPGVEYDTFATTSVLLPLLPQNAHAPRVLVIGASQPLIIDLSGGNPTWQNAGTRQLPGLPARKNLNAVLLPDATVLVVGGSETKLDADAVLAAELYNPANGQWSVLANSAVPRLYHSVALLLPDGRVWTAGSNFNCDIGVKNRELRLEIYSPPYLFQGPRPTITSAPATVSAQPATTFIINTPQANDISSVCILRCGSVTHAFDADQRYVGLAIQSHTATTVTVAAPPNKNVATPGFYLLFVVNGDDVPSIGKFIRIT
jgi:Galactose oxidase-like, Early set domain